MCIYALLIYEFCHLLITRLEAKTLIQGVESFEAELCACLILRLINTEWVNPDTSLESIFPRSLSRFFVPRILSITGLVLTRERFPKVCVPRNFSHSFAEAYEVCRLLETAGHVHIVNRLMEFWRCGRLEDIRRMFEVQVIEEVFPSYTAIIW